MVVQRGEGLSPKASFSPGPLFEAYWMFKRTPSMLIRLIIAVTGVRACEEGSSVLLEAEEEEEETS